MDSGIAGLYHLRGTLYGRAGQYDRAITDFDNALRLNPQLTAVRDARAEALRKKNETY